MSAIRAYLEEKAAMPEKEWLRRDPHTTHPDILQAVREFEEAGGTYNDDAEQHVERVAGDLPEHHYHAHPERHPLTVQLGNEVYIAKGMLKDERSRAALDAAAAAGFRPLEEVTLEAGKRYTVRAGTVCIGQSVPSFGRPLLVRGEETPRGTVGFVRKGARNFVHVPTPTLIREGWE